MVFIAWLSLRNSSQSRHRLPSDGLFGLASERPPAASACLNRHIWLPDPDHSNDGEGSIKKRPQKVQTFLSEWSRTIAPAVWTAGASRPGVFPCRNSNPWWGWPLRGLEHLSAGEASAHSWLLHRGLGFFWGARPKNSGSTHLTVTIVSQYNQTKWGIPWTML